LLLWAAPAAAVVKGIVDIPLLLLNKESQETTIKEEKKREGQQ
jgi:hypothetical protein